MSNNAKKKKQSTIARLPEQGGGNKNPNLNDKDRDAALLALIKKGGRSARVVEDEEQIPEKRISLRIAEDVAERIKQAAKARPIKTPSHTWIVEAILEKLKKEGF
jgi:predicted DNA binding CopG/RHH family protein